MVATVGIVVTGAETAREMDKGIKTSQKYCNGIYVGREEGRAGRAPGKYIIVQPQLPCYTKYPILNHP